MSSFPATQEGTRVSLLAKVEGEEPVIVATLCAGRLDSVALDLFFSEYTGTTASLALSMHWVMKREELADCD